MQQKFIWFIMLLLQQTAEQIINLNKTNNLNVMANCLSRLTTTLEKMKLAIWYSMESEDIIAELLKKIKIPLVINAIEYPKKIGMEIRMSSNLVIIFNNYQINQILNGTLWNGETLFFVVSENFENIRNYLENFWKSKVINVFGLLDQKESIEIYNFIPYKKGNCSTGSLQMVDKFITNTGNFFNNGKAFKDPVKIKNLNGCPINITVVDVKPNVMFEDEYGYNISTRVQGIEGNLINEVAKKLNFNATFLIALDGIGWGWIRPSPHGAVGEVFTGRSDFAIGLLAPTIERYESLDLSLPYNGEECITYGVPSGARASTPNWITILVFEFTSVTWILIFFSFILIFLVFRLVNLFSQVKWFPKKVDLFLYIFSSCLGLPVKIPHYLSLKLSLTCWIIFSFIITVAYKSSMGSKLTVPNRDLDINSFQELIDSKLELTGYNNMLRLLQYNDSEPNIKIMMDRFKVTNFDIDFAVDRIVAEKKIAYVRHTTTFLYYALINPKARGNIHVIKDCIYIYHPMIVTKKYSPFSYRLNQLISRLMESGITKRWRSEYIYNIPPSSKPFLKLSKDHMYGVFCILCLGYVVGLLMFFAEIFDFYLIRQK